MKRVPAGAILLLALCAWSAAPVWAQPNTVLRKSAISTSAIHAETPTLIHYGVIGLGVAASKMTDSTMDMNGGFLQPPWGLERFMLWPVRDLTVRRVGTSTILQWSSLNSVVGYKVFRTVDPTRPIAPEFLIGTVASHSFTDVDVLQRPDDKFYYVVSAIYP